MQANARILKPQASDRPAIGNKTMGKRSASNRQAVVLNQQKPKIGKDEQLRNGKVIEFYQTLENILNLINT